jgi:hypothetical protein
VSPSPVGLLNISGCDSKANPITIRLRDQARGAVRRWNDERGAQFQGDVMKHDPITCTICLRTDRVLFDSESEFHFVPHDSKAAFPLFRLYLAVPQCLTSRAVR